MTDQGLPDGQREALLAERDRLRERIRAIERFLAADAELKATARALPEHGPELADLTVSERPATAGVLAKALNESARSMSLAELTDVVLERGLLGASPNPRAAVRVALTRMVADGSAVKVARGHWTAPEGGES